MTLQCVLLVHLGNLWWHSMHLLILHLKVPDIHFAPARTADRPVAWSQTVCLPSKPDMKPDKAMPLIVNQEKCLVEPKPHSGICWALDDAQVMCRSKKAQRYIQQLPCAAHAQQL